MEIQRHPLLVQLFLNSSNDEENTLVKVWPTLSTDSGLSCVEEESANACNFLCKSRSILVKSTSSLSMLGREISRITFAADDILVTSKRAGAECIISAVSKWKQFNAV